MEHIQATPALRWAIVQRAFWVHGIDSLLQYLKIASDYSLKKVANQIRCPTLLTWAESDPLSWNADRIHEDLTCPKALIRFTNAEEAGDHCEAKTRPLFHQRAFNWLDEALSPSALPW
jgi:pimeloyl-ACP methyl ester carboxylesterase